MKIFNPSSNSDRLTYDDSNANLVDGTTAANIKNAIVNIDGRLDSTETAVQEIQNTQITLSSGNRIVAGETFDFTPVIGDRWYEQTADGTKVEDWRWNGTYWLSDQVYNTQINLVNLTANNSFAMSGDFSSDLFIRKYTAAFINPGNNDGLNYWNFTLSRVIAPNTLVNLRTISTTSVAPSVSANVVSVLNLHILSSSITHLRALVGKVGNPNSVNLHLIVTYQKARIEPIVD